MKMVLALGAALVMTTAATASTPAAWDQMNQRVNRACIAMSGLARPQLLAKKVSFSDVIGVEIRQIRGVDDRGWMKRLRGACKRSAGKTKVQDGDVWNGPTTRR